MKRIFVMIAVSALTAFLGTALALCYYRFLLPDDIPPVDAEKVTSARVLPVDSMPQPSEFSLLFKGFAQRRGKVTAEFQLTNNSSEVAYYRTAKRHSNCSVFFRRGEEVIESCPCCTGGGFGVLSVAPQETVDFWGVEMEEQRGRIQVGFGMLMGEQRRVQLVWSEPITVP